MKIDRRSFVPLYVQLKNIVQRQIMSGELSTGAPLQSEPALGRAYGVSRITVRQALDELEAEGLIRREPGRGTFVASTASKRGLVIGLLFGGMSERTFGHRNDTSFGDLVRGVADAASQRGALVHPIPLGDHDRLDLALATPTVRQLNGLLVRLAQGFDEETLASLDATGLPYVIVKRRVPPGRASCVCADDLSGAEAATAHLLGLGQRRIALLLGPTEIGAWEERRLGFERAHVKANIPLDPSLIVSVGYPMDEASFDVTRSVLARSDRPTAVFAGNDYMAIGVYRAIRDLGYEPGRDIPVVGYGGTVISTTMYPGLTTVSVSGHQLGSTSADLLLDLITGVARGAHQVCVPWRLDVRRSSVWELNARGAELATTIDGVASAG